jgi:hypothetical protein
VIAASVFAPRPRGRTNPVVSLLVACSANERFAAFPFHKPIQSGGIECLFGPFTTSCRKCSFSV